ncbi:type II toxin-antitoxin system HicB family antitoxin [bacterium]|nr:type II toxin-antitoxin system HicB family antitoxin [bacterium]MBU1599241.1 type II toxin-antitoxin system HicB family antitoxin [bacterium]
MKKDVGYYMKLKYPIKITPTPEEEGGGYCAEISNLYGCLGDGETIEEALKNLEDVKYTTIEMLLEKKKPIPEPTIHLEIPWSAFKLLKQKEEVERFIAV